MIRFYSFLALQRFLLGLRTLGYAAPSFDLKAHFISKGFNKDLHLYPCDIIFTPAVIILTFNTPMSKHREDKDYVSNYLPPLTIECKKEINDGF